MSTVANADQELVQFDTLQAEVTLTVRPCHTLVVTDQESDLQAAETLRKLKAMEKRLEAFWEERTRPLLEAKRSWDDRCKRVENPIKDAERYVKSQRKAFADEEAKRIRDEQERLAAAERERAAADAKRRREEQEVAEAKRREEECVAREKAEAERKAFLEEQAKKAKAAALFRKPLLSTVPAAPAVDELQVLRDRQEKERLEEKARAEREEEERKKSFEAEQRRIADSRPKNVRKDKQFAVEDLSKIPLKYLLPNLVEIRKAVLRGEEITGVRTWEETNVISR